MVEAEKMVAVFVSAGYERIHIDTRRGCWGEVAQLEDELCAERAARLAVVAERPPRQQTPSPIT